MGRRSSAKWIVIEDLTERRRAQNRLAQRKKRQRARVLANTQDTQRPSDTSSPDRHHDGENASTLSEGLSPAATNAVASHEDFLDLTTLFGSRAQAATGEFQHAFSSDAAANDGLFSETYEQRRVNRPIFSTSPSTAASASSQQWPLGQDFDHNSQLTPYSELWKLGISGSSNLSDTPTTDSVTVHDEWSEGSRSRSVLLSKSRSLGRSPSELPNSKQDSSHTCPSQGPQTTISSTAPLQQRLQHIVDAVRAAGFDSFDSMALQYYTASLPDDTPLLEMQHRSRRRGIPHLFAGLSREARSWPRREAQSFEETALNLVEKIVGHEADDYARARRGRDSGGCSRAPPPPSAAALRDELPITWSIFYETAAAYLPSEMERSNFVRQAIDRLVPGR